MNPYASQWRRVRLEVLDRDRYECKVRGPKCRQKADQVDHIIPVADGGALYDPTNLRAACSWCNTWRAQRQKSRDGWKRSTTRVVLVMGPPGGGMAEHVAAHARGRDLVIDYEAIAQALGRAAHHELVNKLRGSLLSKVRRGEADAPRVWIVSANPKAERLFPHHEVVTCDPGRERALAGAGLANAGRVDDWYRARAGGRKPRREW